MSEPLLQVRELSVEHRVRRPLGRRGRIRAVDGVSFELARGETLGLVGESGCGKTTLARALLGLVAAQTGTVQFAGTELIGASAAQLRAVRRRMQMVFQDPYSSLNPRWTVADSVGEGLAIHRLAQGETRKKRVSELIDRMGLPAEAFSRYPHELSGGQRQRVAIARALAVGPELVIADEPLSALDLSVQAQIVNLLSQLQVELGLSYLFIGHDLRMVRHVSGRVAVMYRGRLVELGPAEAVCSAPLHPYSQALVGAALPVHPDELPPPFPALSGDPPSPLSTISGCALHPRCPLADERCRQESPALRDVRPGHQVACHQVPPHGE